MSEAHLKDYYVAQVVVLTGENKVLKNELAECRRRLNIASWYPVVFFAIGYFLACILWRLLP